RTSLAATVSAVGDRLSIGFDEPLEAAEFFPYREGLVANAAAQLLHAANDPGQPARRLELVLSADGQRAAATPGGGVEAAEGIVVAGDRVFELSPSAANASLMGGTLIARVEGA